jgi:hypothetical protein
VRFLLTADVLTRLYGEFFLEFFLKLELGKQKTCSLKKNIFLPLFRFYFSVNAKQNPKSVIQQVVGLYPSAKFK